MLYLVCQRQGLFCYWGVNNVFSILQTVILGVRQIFNIPKMPAAEDQPTMKMANFSGKIKSVSLMACTIKCARNY